MRQLAREVVAANPRVQAQRQVVEQLRAKLSAARSGYLPKIDGSALIQRRRLDIIGSPSDQSFTLGEANAEARLPIADGGRTSAAIETARAELRNGEATLSGVINDTLLDLVRATATVQSARAVQGFVRQQHDAIAGELQATERRLQLHDATLTDVDQARARLASSDAALLDADEQVAATTSRFAAVSGRPAEAAPPVPDLPVGPPTLDEARVRAMEDSPALLAAQNAVAAGEGTVQAARANLAPSVELVAGYDYLTGGVANLFTGRLPSDRSAAYVGASARVPIFQRGAEFAEIRRAKAVRGQRQFEELETGREVVRDVELAWTRTRAARAIANAAHTAVAANESAVAGVTREAGLGARTTVDVLDAQNDLLSARITEQRATASEVDARATLLSALGALAPALLGDGS